MGTCTHPIVAACMVMLGCASAMAADVISAGRFVDTLPVRSWSAIRDEGVVKQRFDYSCGAAALAGLMGHYDVQASELDVIDRIGVKPEFSMADLARVAREYGFTPVGLALDYEMLMRFQHPVIVYLGYWDEGHFSVLRGIDRHGVWLADPAWGNTRMRRARFELFWNSGDDIATSGKVLALLPAAGLDTASGNEHLHMVGGQILIPPPANYELLW